MNVYEDLSRFMGGKYFMGKVVQCLGKRCPLSPKLQVTAGPMEVLPFQSKHLFKFCFENFG